MNILTSYVQNVMSMFISVCGSMVMGLRTFTRPNVTTEYPRKEKWDIPDGSRMKLYNNIDDCIGCYKCSRICPTDCIEIETIKAPDDVDLGTASTGNPLNFWVPTFDIDMVKCCYCDLCTTVCPTECLVMTKAYEGSAYDRGNLVYHFGNVDSEEMEEINQLLQEDEEEGAAPAAEDGAGADSDGEQPSSVMGKLIPDSIEGLPVKERIRARLIVRGKMEGDLPEGAEVDESASPAGMSGSGGGTTATAPATETETETEPATEEEDDETPAPDEDQPAEEPSEEESTQSEAESDEEETPEDSGVGGEYTRDPDLPLRERIENRLKARGKL